MRHVHYAKVFPSFRDVNLSRLNEFKSYSDAWWLVVLFRELLLLTKLFAQIICGRAGVGSAGGDE